MENEIVYRNVDGQVVTSSLLVAESFGKQHFNVLKDIEELLIKSKNLSLTENQQLSSMFFKTIYETSLNNGTGAVKRNPMYLMNRDGFTLLVMGYTGQKALEFKLKYITAFNEMENRLNSVTQIPHQFMETQMQLMQQMMNLCSNMMSRIEKLEEQQKPILQQTTKRDIPKIKHQHQIVEEVPVIDESKHHGFCRPGKYSQHVLHLEEIQRLYPHFKKVRDVAKGFRDKGIPVHQKPFFRYLRAKGYLCSDLTLYNRPSLSCEEKGWMVSVWSGPSNNRKPKRCSYVPYLSPEFVAILEVELRKEYGMGESQLSLPLETK